MTVTANEIANACGVSRGTVDRALNNRPGINPETKARILKVAKELGYKPDFLAKSLVTGKTMSIGVVVFDISTPFFGQLVTSIETRARKSGYFTYLTLTQKDRVEEYKCIQHLIDRKVDGIILFSINKGADFDTYLKSLTIPVVTITNKVNNELDFVGIDERRAVSDAINFLSKNGHTDILYVSTPMDTQNNVNMYAVEKRMQGYIDACKSLCITIDKNNIITEKNYHELVLNRMNNSPRPSAIMCSNDKYALEIMRILKLNGYKIPQDVSIMGFDNINTLDYIEPGLTTIEFPIDEMGEQAVKILIDRMISRDEIIQKEQILEHKLIIRESVGSVGR